MARDLADTFTSNNKEARAAVSSSLHTTPPSILLCSLHADHIAACRPHHDATVLLKCAPLQCSLHTFLIPSPFPSHTLPHVILVMCSLHPPHTLRSSLPQVLLRLAEGMDKVAQAQVKASQKWELDKLTKEGQFSELMDSAKGAADSLLAKLIYNGDAQGAGQARTALKLLNRKPIDPEEDSGSTFPSRIDRRMDLTYLGPIALKFREVPAAPAPGVGLGLGVTAALGPRAGPLIVMVSKRAASHAPRMVFCQTVIAPRHSMHCLNPGTGQVGQLFRAANKTSAHEAIVAVAEIVEKASRFATTNEVHTEEEAARRDQQEEATFDKAMHSARHLAANLTQVVHPPFPPRWCFDWVVMAGWAPRRRKDADSPTAGPAFPIPQPSQWQGWAPRAGPGGQRLGKLHTCGDTAPSPV